MISFDLGVTDHSFRGFSKYPYSYMIAGDCHLYLELMGTVFKHSVLYLLVTTVPSL